jgi:hypothetical protein
LTPERSTATGRRQATGSSPRPSGCRRDD